MPAINADTRAFWQSLADQLSRQRPYPGRRVTVVAGRKHRGKVGMVVLHQRDRYEDAFRYGNEASQHFTEMAGRRGFVTLVREDSGGQFWVKASYLQVEYPYEHWSVALADAILSGTPPSPAPASRKRPAGCTCLQYRAKTRTQVARPHAFDCDLNKCLVAQEVHHMAPACQLQRDHGGGHDWEDE